MLTISSTTNYSYFKNELPIFIKLLLNSKAFSNLKNNIVDVDYNSQGYLNSTLTRNVKTVLERMVLKPECTKNCLQILLKFSRPGVDSSFCTPNKLPGHILNNKYHTLNSETIKNNV